MSLKLNKVGQMMNALIRRSNSPTSTKIKSTVIFTIALVFGVIQPTTSLTVTSTYSGALTVRSPAFIRPGDYLSSYYFYQALQFKAFIGGEYIFQSSISANMDPVGCLYQTSFDPSNSSNNLIICNRDSGQGYQFLFANTLLSGDVYILVVTTTSNFITHDYSVTVDGPGSIAMIPLSPVISIFNGSLSSNSGNYSRPDAEAYNFYYQAMYITNYTRGPYTFRSDSTMSSYGYLYDGTFNPISPQDNMITSDDSSAGDSQFLLAYFLETNVKYTLVYTSEYENITGNFTIISTGPGSLTLVPFTVKKPFDMTNIIGIIYASFIAGIVLLSILTCKKPRIFILKQ